MSMGWQIVVRTPSWVWLLLAVLLAFGLLQSRTRVVRRATVPALPLVMGALSLVAVWNAFGFSVAAYAAWIAAFLLVTGLNRNLAWPRDVARDSPHSRVRVGGSWVPLALMPGLFSTRYALAVAFALRPGLAGASGLAAGRLLSKLLA